MLKQENKSGILVSLKLMKKEPTKCFTILLNNKKVYKFCRFAQEDNKIYGKYIKENSLLNKRFTIVNEKLIKEIRIW